MYGPPLCRKRISAAPRDNRNEHAEASR